MMEYGVKMEDIEEKLSKIKIYSGTPTTPYDFIGPIEAKVYSTTSFSKARFIALLRIYFGLQTPHLTHLDWAKIGYNSEKLFNNIKLINNNQKRNLAHAEKGGKFGRLNKSPGMGIR